MKPQKKCFNISNRNAMFNRRQCFPRWQPLDVVLKKNKSSKVCNILRAKSILITALFKLITQNILSIFLKKVIYVNKRLTCVLSASTQPFCY